VTSSVAVFEAAMPVKSTYMIKSCLKPRKKEKGQYGNQKNVHINFHLKDGLGMEFTAF